MPNYNTLGAFLQGLNKGRQPMLDARLLQQQAREQQARDLQMAMVKMKMEEEQKRRLLTQQQDALTQAKEQATRMMTPLQGLPPISQMGSNVYAGQGFPMSPTQTGGIYPNMPAGFQPKTFNPFAAKPEDILSLERMPLPELPDYLGQRKKLVDIGKTEAEIEEIKGKKPSAKDIYIQGLYEKLNRKEQLTDKEYKTAGQYIAESGGAFKIAPERVPQFKQDLADAMKGITTGKGKPEEAFNRMVLEYPEETSRLRMIFFPQSPMNLFLGGLLGQGAE